MGAKLRLIANAFEPDSAQEWDAHDGETVRDALARLRPDWMLREVVAFINARPANLTDSIGPDDVVTVCIVPEYAPQFWLAVGKLLLQALVVAAVTYAINSIFFPKRKDGRNASPAYSITIDQNAPRIGEVIPVIYGRVRALPDIASQPYAEYVTNSQQRVNMILCLGMGEYDIHQIYVGGTRISDYPANTIRTWVFPPSAHGQTLGNIFGVTGIAEDMNTVLESTQVDLAAPNDSPEITLPGNTSGSNFDPQSPDSGLWAGLVVGQRYVITNSAGTSVIATYLGVGVNNIAQFDQPLPPALQQSSLTFYTALSYVSANQQGVTAILVPPSGQPLPPDVFNIKVGEIVSFVRNDTGQMYGPMQYMGPMVNAGYPQFALTGNGFTATMPTFTFPQTTQITMTRAVVNNYTIKEYYETGSSDGFRWRGWFAMSPPGTTTDFLFVDIVFPGGITWITDKGDYRVTTVHIRAEYQLIDDDSNPVGGVFTQNWAFSNSTNNPQRFTRPISVPVGRYRMRITRTSNRDQRPSKESSVAILDALRGRIYHPPGTAAYEACTIIVMQFTASSGLAAAQNRRIQVDCTRRLPIQGVGAPTNTTNPADAVIDAYTASYGAAAPLTDLDTATLARLRTQWATTGGFNGIFDQPLTVLEAMQTILTPVRTLVMPVGSAVSFVQECPRPRQYVFGPGSIVADTLQIGYAWDAENDSDHVTVTYQNPRAWQEGAVRYPLAGGVRPQPYDLFGVTNVVHAQSWARLTWQERTYARKKVRFKLEGDGYMLTPFARFALAVPAIGMGEGGRIINYDPLTKTLELDAEFPRTTPGFQPKLILTYYDVGGASPPIDVQPLPYASRIITVTGELPYNPIASDSLVGDGTQWFATKTFNVLMEFRVTDVQPAGDFQVEVSGIEYNPAVYAGTFLESWTP